MHDRTTQYALDVLDGKIVAGTYVKMACKRHLDDIKRSEDDEYKFYFDIEEAERIIDFAETLTIAEGEEERRLQAYPFQCFILGSLNGWRKKEGKHRRFRTSYIQIGRQNGKSFLNGILAAYYGNFSGFKYGQIYCTATKKDQAAITFNEIVKFINADEELAELFRVHEYNTTVECLVTKSKIRALAGDTKRIDGFRPYLGIVDEYHAHKNDQMYKLLEGGIKMLKSALISVITTAGFDQKSPCFELYEYCVKVLERVVENDTQFIYIAQMNKNDDMWKPENWIKANPILEYNKEELSNMVPIAETAREMGGNTLRDFIVKQLNEWVQWTDNIYIKDIEEWIRSAAKKSLEDFRGKKCYIGLDLSSGGDLTSLAVVIPFEEDETKKYYVHVHSFIPKRRLEEHIKTDKAPYDVWKMQGLVEVTETLGGVKTDYKYIIRYLKKMVEDYDLDIQWICYDPHNASAFLNDLEECGWDSIAVTQSARALNDATVDFRLEIESGNVQHDGNGMLQWSLANARTVSNSYGEIKIDKEYNTDRIDVVDAIIDAWTEAMKEEEKPDANKYLEEWFKYEKTYFQKGGAEK